MGSIGFLIGLALLPATVPDQPATRPATRPAMGAAAAADAAAADVRGLWRWAKQTPSTFWAGVVTAADEQSVTIKPYKPATAKVVPASVTCRFDRDSRVSIPVRDKDGKSLKPPRRGSPADLKPGQMVFVTAEDEVVVIMSIEKDVPSPPTRPAAPEPL